MTKTSRSAAIGFALCAASSLAFATPVVHTTDFIADNARTHFNGFEAIPNATLPEFTQEASFFTGGNGPYVEGGIRVRQVNGDPGNDILVNYREGIHEGIRSWYPSGGTDRNSYTEITMADGSDFSNFGFYLSSGGAATLIYFDILNDSNSVLSGSVPAPRQSVGQIFEYLGFSGGGFDTIRVRNNIESWPTRSTGSTVYDGWTALMLDSLETGGTGGGGPAPIPEPGTILILGLGLAALQIASCRGNSSRVLRLDQRPQSLP
jgi:hypothetical protein